ncbi:MAG: hypothetical protein ACP5J8_01385 [Minisyncoccia bacterium]
MVFLEKRIQKFLETFFNFDSKLIQSFLFYGEKDLGKKEVALYFAQSMMCQEAKKTWGGCGKCNTCKNFEKGITDDLLILEPDESNSIKIELVRKAIEFLSYKPYISSYRVLIINEADKLTFDAQNALLKTLEEPPLDSLIILITSRHKALLETVRSRLLPIRFYCSSFEEISNYLIENYRITPLKAQKIAQLSQGKIKLALKLLDENYFKNINLIQDNFEKLIKVPPLSRLALLDSILKDKKKHEVIEIITLWLEKIHLDLISNPDVVNKSKLKILAFNLLNAFNLINQYNININLLLENIFLQL